MGSSFANKPCSCSNQLHEGVVQKGICYKLNGTLLPSVESRGRRALRSKVSNGHQVDEFGRETSGPLGRDDKEK